MVFLGLTEEIPNHRFPQLQLDGTIFCIFVPCLTGISAPLKNVSQEGDRHWPRLSSTTTYDDGLELYLYLYTLYRPRRGKITFTKQADF